MKTFNMGGIHPPENKLTSEGSIIDAGVPPSVFIPINQHIGAPAEIIVETGQKVKEGEVIAKAKKGLSVNIHSSISGKVGKIKDMMLANGFKGMQIEIIADTNQSDTNLQNESSIKKEISAEKESIVETIAEAGIVGMGGATFPTYYKLKVPKDKQCEYLIINGAECEPYLTADHVLMREKTDEILIGIQILMKALGVEKCFIGIENNKKDVILKFKERIQSLGISQSSLRVEALKVKYPQGGEKQLIKSLINREVPPGGLPIDVGAIVQNVGTAFAVYEALQKGKPLYQRVVSVTGKALENPANFLVRIGTPFSYLIEKCGGIKDGPRKIISGGPMMGKAVSTQSPVVEKGTSGILVLPEEETKRPDVQPCIRCSRCSQACCIGLEPHLIIKLSQRNLFERCVEEKVMDCLECGSCSFICPSGQPLLDYIRLAKQSTIQKQKKESQKAS